MCAALIHIALCCYHTSKSIFICFFVTLFCLSFSASAVLKSAKERMLLIENISSNNNSSNTKNTSGDKSSSSIDRSDSNSNINSFEMVAGSGVRCRCSEGVVRVGTRAFLEQSGVSTQTALFHAGPFVKGVSDELDVVMRGIQSQGKTAVCVALDGQLLGVLGIADVPKVVI